MPRFSDAFFFFSICQATQLDQLVIKKIRVPNEISERSKAVVGFYPENPVAIIQQLKSPADCSLLCSYHDQCASINIVKTREQLFTCFLHGSILKRKSGLITTVRIEASIYSEVSVDRHNNARVDHGPATSSCGIDAFTSVPRRTKRIIGGYTVEPYSQPWLGIVMEDRRDVCGISLIAKRRSDVATLYGLSAAHCFFDSEKEFRIRVEMFGFIFGLHDSRILTPHTVYRKAKRIHINPDFNAKRVQHDLALVEFTRKVTFNDYVRPICLPPNFELQKDSFKPFEYCLNCGWGMVNEKIGSDSLNCIRISKRLSLFEGHLHKSRLEHKMAYVKWNGALKGSYLGDSGGSYACRNNDNDPFMLYGVSSGVVLPTRDRPTSYNVFSITHLHLKWINSILHDQRTKQLVMTTVSPKGATPRIKCLLFGLPYCFRMHD